MTFPREFAWGAATAAYQIEGATDVDGRGESIWDRFCRTPGKVANGDTGDRACDHYHRWPEDLDLMAALGLHAYRFSIAWPRIQPDGSGPANTKGLDFYRRLVEGLLARGITPLATLYHWDLPQRLQDEGGWASREIVDRFVDYAQLVFDALDDVVDSWITHNEPWVTAFLGYGKGVKAPGLADWRTALAAAHHVLLSHGRATHAFRERDGGEIGITLDLTHVSGEPGAVRRLDGHRNRWFLDPVLRGGYPADMVDLYEGRVGPLDFVRPGDLDEIAAPIDFLGVNFYQPAFARSGPDGPLMVEEVPWEGRQTAMGWTVDPSSLTEVLLRVKRDYGDRPLVITENGASYDDPPANGPVVEDPERVAYLRDHIAAVEQAVDGGVDVRGYYVWSLLDNFEWEQGYASRFGIIAVDFDDQSRTPKRSALWYRDLIARHENRG